MSIPASVENRTSNKEVDERTGGYRDKQSGHDLVRVKSAEALATQNHDPNDGRLLKRRSSTGDLRGPRNEVSRPPDRSGTRLSAPEKPARESDASALVVPEQARQQPPDMLRAEMRPDLQQENSNHVLDKPPSTDVKSSLDITFQGKTYNIQDLKSFVHDYEKQYKEADSNKEKIGPINFAGRSFKDFAGFKNFLEDTIDKMVPPEIADHANRILANEENGLSSDDKQIKSEFDKAKQDKGFMGQIFNMVKENKGLMLFLYLDKISNAAQSMGEKFVQAAEQILRAQGGGGGGGGMPFIPGMSGKGEQGQEQPESDENARGKAGKAERTKAPELPARVENVWDAKEPSPPLHAAGHQLGREISGDLDKASVSGDGSARDSASVFSRGSSRRSSVSSVSSDAPDLRAPTPPGHEVIKNGGFQVLKRSLSKGDLRSKAGNQETEMHGALLGKA